MIFKRLTVFILLLSTQLTISQSQIKGQILSIEKEPLQGTTIILKSQDSQKTINFTNLSENGSFTIIAKKGTYTLDISYLGYKKTTKLIEVFEGDLEMGIITLTQNTSVLEEVFLQAEKNIIIRGDTTIYKTKKFLNGNEKNLLDILLNLPEIGINQNGQVTYRGKVVDRLLLDNENLFKNQHQFATENIPSEMIGNVEVIKNYKDFENISKNDKTGITALNININDNFKGKITGVMDVEAGIENKYLFKPLLFNFRKKIKSSLISNFNNTGVAPLTTQDYNELINANPIDYDSNSSKVVFIKNDNIPQFILAKDKVKSRSSNFSTLSAVISPSKKIKLDFYNIFNHSRQKRLFSKEQTLTTNTFPLSNFENQSIIEENYFGISHIKGVYKTNETSVLIFDYNLDLDISRQNIFTENTTNDTIGFYNEQIKPKKIASKFNLSYSKQFETSLLKTNIYLNNVQNDSDLDIMSNQSFLGLQFDTNDFQINQRLKRNDFLAGFNLSYLIKYKNIESKIYLINAYNKSKLFSTNNSLEIGKNNLNLKSIANSIGSNFSYRVNNVFKTTLGINYN